MQVIKFPDRTTWTSLLKRPAFDSTSLFETVQKILDAVHKDGDKAVQKYTKEFDKISLDKFEVTKDEILEAETLISVNLKQAIGNGPS